MELLVLVCVRLGSVGFWDRLAEVIARQKTGGGIWLPPCSPIFERWRPGHQARGGPQKTSFHSVFFAGKGVSAVLAYRRDPGGVFVLSQPSAARTQLQQSQ